MNTTNRNKNKINESQIIGLIKRISPAPSNRFYKKIDNAPWKANHHSTRLSLQAGLAIGIITFLFFLSPIDPITPLSNTYTPTATNTTTATIIPDTPMSTPTVVSFIPQTPTQ